MMDTPITVAFQVPNIWIVFQDGYPALRYIESENLEPGEQSARNKAIEWGSILAAKFNRTLIVQNRAGRVVWTRPAREKP